MQGVYDGHDPGSGADVMTDNEGLSADGFAPVTHYWAGWNMQATGDDPQVVAQEAMMAGGYSAQAVSPIPKGSTPHSGPIWVFARSEWDPWDAIAALGLEEVEDN